MIQIFQPITGVNMWLSSTQQTIVIVDIGGRLCDSDTVGHTGKCKQRLYTISTH